MSNPICDTVFDSRDLIIYREELESDIWEAYVEWAENHNEGVEEDQDELEIPETFEEIEFIDEEAFTSTCKDLIDEYEDIRDFVDELEGYGDFDHGETIIHEDFFEEYCKELCEEIGDIPKDLPGYIENNIDWGGVADDLRMDYMTATYQRSDYYMRA